MAKKRNKAKWIILSVILLVVIVSAVLILYFNALNKGKRFVDTISKISREDYKEAIQEHLNNFSKAIIDVEVDNRDNMEKIIASLSKESFELYYKSDFRPVFSGNASKEAILKLNKNSHVIEILSSIPIINDAQAQNQTENKPYVDPAIYESFVMIEGEEWVKVDVWSKSQDDLGDIIDSLSPSESKVVRIGEDFSVIVTKKGLEKLANDTRVKSIYLVSIGELI